MRFLRGIAAGNPGSVSPSLVLHRSTGVAPLFVFADCTLTTSTQTTRPYHDCLYHIDWGDAGAGTWGLSGKTKEVSWGPVGGHVYETAGTFTVTLTVYDGNSTNTTTGSVTVTAADTYYSTTNTVVVANGVDFTGKPTGATEVTSSDWDSVINTYVATGKRVLFKAGDTFTGSVAPAITAAGPWHVGKWSTGADPIVNLNSAVNALNLSEISAAPTCSDGRIVDIDFNGQSDGTAGGGGVAAVGGFTNILILRGRFRDIRYAVSYSTSQLELSNGTPFTVPVWDGCAIVDTVVDTMVGGGGSVGIFLAGTRLAIMGVDLDDCLDSEHGIRVTYGNKFIVQHGRTQNMPASKHHLTIRAVPWEAAHAADDTIPDHSYTGNAVISNNLYVGGLNPWTMHFHSASATFDSSDPRMQNIIVENNRYTAGSGSQEFIKIYVGEGNFTIRNNIAVLTGANSRRFSGSSAHTAGVHVENVHFYNNTIYCADAGAINVFLSEDDVATVEFVNNLAYAPNGTAGSTKMFATAGSYTLATQSGNSSDSQLKSTDPLFVSATPSADADFAIQTGSYAKNAGTEVDVWQDYFRTARNTGTTIDIGAHQYT